MYERLRTARARRAEIVHEQDLILRSDTPSAEDLERWDRLDTEFRTLSEEIRRLEVQLERNRAASTISQRDLSHLPRGDREPDPSVDQRAAYSQAFAAWARRGMAEIPPEQQQVLRAGYADLSRESRALGTLTGPIGGYTVPDVFLAELMKTLLFYGGMLGVAQVLTTDTGATLTWPTLNDTSNKGRRISENAAVTQTDISFGQKALDAYLYSSDAVLVPYTLLQDTAIPLEQVLVDALGERIGRILNDEFTDGTGVNMPEGVVTNVTTGKAGATGQTASVTYDDLIDLIHSVDRAYRNERSRFMMHDLSLAIVRKLKDGEGRPIFQVSFQAGEPDRILSYPITINNDMAQMAASTKSILFGDFFRAYLIRQVRDVQLVRATERWIDNLQVGFFAFARYDGILRETAAVKSYVNSAT